MGMLSEYFSWPKYIKNAIKSWFHDECYQCGKKAWFFQKREKYYTLEATNETFYSHKKCER